MNKKVFSVLATCCLAVIAATTARAQMPGTEIRARIPFDFSVRGKTLPAGIYEIKRVMDGPETLTISNVNDKHDRATFETQSAGETPRHSELVFHRYGDNYFLFEVFAGGRETGRELPETRQERVLQREMASNGNNTRPETVALAAY